MDSESTQPDIDYLNNIRLAFWPAPDGEKEDSLRVAESHACLTRLVRDCTSEELLFKAKLLMEAATNVLALVYSEKNRDDIRLRAKVESDKKKAIAEKIHTRDTDKVKQTEKLRAQEEVKKSGKPLSKDGECLLCHSPSIAKFCSDICEAKHKAYKTWLDIGMNVEAIEQMIEEMGK